MPVLVVLMLLVAGCSSGAESEGVVSTLNEQILLLATVLGTVAALPALIEFLIDRRKRRERIALSLDDVPVVSLKPRLAGMDELLVSIEDLIDRARHPKEYASLNPGNELLIVGPNLSGKKSLAYIIAQRSNLERLITVYNPRNADALAKAKSLVSSDHSDRIMLLLPRIDQAFEKEDEEVLTELEALIESTAEQANVLVVGTAVEIVPNSTLDNLFGIKLVLPGGTSLANPPEPPGPEMRRVLADATRFYLSEAQGKGFALHELTEDQFVSRVLEVASNAAEVEDMVALCQTSALYERRIRRRAQLLITAAMLETAISRVVTCPPAAANGQSPTE